MELEKNMKENVNFNHLELETSNVRPTILTGVSPGHLFYSHKQPKILYIMLFKFYISNFIYSNLFTYSTSKYQQINKPTDQQTNRPTDQQTYKPINQSTNIIIYSLERTLLCRRFDNLSSIPIIKAIFLKLRDYHANIQTNMLD